ncbi:SDR family NAD(P)-dependent oxidoreductase [uncultured Sphingomonas sp.]|uniref:SDR family NAD(P)-dependent oxidoreductase n=1 Tax=uncultured Sphingomonas sp. TaxID=158754 RepID=UPI002636A884|nr:SDR family NAD(P)-dependent oxidoreductase [uncultured Sphingomonas sp.]
MTYDLTGRVALVTGASGNIGAAIARKLRADGAMVVSADLPGHLGGGESEDWHALDIVDETSWATLIAWIEGRHGRLDILVNNAGIAPMGKLEDMAIAEWRRCMAINVDGAFLGIRTALPLLRTTAATAGHDARIVNVASAAGVRASPLSSAYCTSKAAVGMLTKAAAIEFASLGYPVRANSVHPAAVESDMIDAILDRYSAITGGTPVDDLRAGLIAGHPFGRLVRPDEVADAVLFLCSEAARYLNATEIHVDGGMIAS